MNFDPVMMQDIALMVAKTFGVGMLIGACASVGGLTLSYSKQLLNNLGRG